MNKAMAGEWMNNIGYAVLAVIGGYLVSYWCGYLVRFLLRKHEKDIKISGLRGAGFAIGVIERILVLTFILLNQYTAITIIFAGKSIARFNELKNRTVAEYYLLGTLISITLALIIGVVVKMLIGGAL